MKLNLLFVLFIGISLLMTLSCSEDEAPTGAENTIAFTFDADLDGWVPGIAGGGLDAVRWIDWGGQPEGAVEMDGSDFGTSDGQANAWIYQEIELPGDATTLKFQTSTHDRDGANAHLRVRLVDAGGVSHTLIDWEVGEPGVEGQLVWIDKSVSIAAYAGQTVTIFFEQGDNDIGFHEQRYLDNIVIE